MQLFKTSTGNTSFQDAIVLFRIHIKRLLVKWLVRRPRSPSSGRPRRVSKPTGGWASLRLMTGSVGHIEVKFMVQVRMLGLVLMAVGMRMTGD